MSCAEISNMKNIIFSAKFTLIPLGVTLVNLRGREHKLPRNFPSYVWTHIDLWVLSIYTTIGDACVCVCVFAKLDQFLPVRSHFDTKRPVNFFHIATFPSPTSGPLFAFHCPLFFTKNNNLHAAMFWKVTVTTQDRPLNRKHLQPLTWVVHW